MHKIEIPEIQYCQEIPSCVNEMNQEQYLFLIKNYLKLLDNKISIQQFKEYLIVHLLDIRITPKYYRLSDDERLIIDAEIYRLSELANSFFIIDKNKYSLNLFSIKNFIPEIKIKFNTLYGPASGFVDLTFMEFIHANDFFIEYTKNQNLTALNNLCSTLYRPQINFYEIAKHSSKFDGNRRIKYNQNFCKINAEKFSDVPFEYRFAIYQHFQNFNEFIQTNKINVSGSEVDLGILFTPSSTEDKSQLGWISVLYTIAETGVFGNIQQTSEQNIYDILLYIYNNIKELQKLKNKKPSNDTN